MTRFDDYIKGEMRDLKSADGTRLKLLRKIDGGRKLVVVYGASKKKEKLLMESLEGGKCGEEALRQLSERSTPGVACVDTLAKLELKSEGTDQPKIDLPPLP